MNRELYVMQADGQHVGPITAETVVRAIADGKIPRDALVAVPGSPSWTHA